MQLNDHWRRSQVFAAGMAPLYAVAARHSGDFAPHDHEFVEIVLVLGGRASHETRTGVAPLQAGDMLVLRPGVWHGYRGAVELRIFNCCFGPELLERELAWTLDDPGIGTLLWGPRQLGGSIHLHLPAVLLRRAAEAMGPVVHPDAYAPAIGRLLVFLGTLAGAVRADRPPPIAPPVAKAVRAIDADLARPWRIDELAGVAGVSAAYLTRRFTSAMGVSPIAYIARCRAERAAAQLIQTDLPIADIAIAVGWPDPVYFARRFRQQMGQSPRAYRRQFRAADRRRA